MRKIFIISLTIALILIVILATAGSIIFRNNEMKNIEILNAIDSRILQDYTLSKLEKCTNIEQLSDTLNKLASEYNRQADEGLNKLLIDLKLNLNDSWKDFENELNLRCVNKLGFTIQSENFTKFYQGNIIADGLTHQEKMENTLYMAMQIYVYAKQSNEDLISYNPTIEDVIKLVKKNICYRSIIKPYLDQIEIKDKPTVPTTNYRSVKSRAVSRAIVWFRFI